MQFSGEMVRVRLKLINDQAGDVEGVSSRRVPDAHAELGLLGFEN